MKRLILITIFVLFCIFYKADGTGGNCRIACTREYKPVCAQWRRFMRNSMCTFSNMCLLNARRCLNPHERWEVMEKGECKKETSDCKRLRVTVV